MTVRSLLSSRKIWCHLSQGFLPYLAYMPSLYCLERLQRERSALKRRASNGLILDWLFYSLSAQTLYTHGLFCDMNPFKVSPVCISGNKPLLYGYQLMRVLKNSEIRSSQGHVLHITVHAQIVIVHAHIVTAHAQIVTARAQIVIRYSALGCTLVAAYRLPFLSAMHCYSYCMYCIPCCSLFLTSVF